MKNAKAVADELSKILADTYILYLQTHNFHWNVTGPQFPVLHALFEEQYNELFKALDGIAERIRALGFYAPGSLAAYSKLSSLREANGIFESKQMIEVLVKNHELLIKNLRAAFSAVEKAEDHVTSDLLTERLSHHEKTTWMLRSVLA